MLRHLSIPWLLFNILRPQYALNHDSSPTLNVFYKFLFCCLAPLFPKIESYEAWCKKYYALAANDGSCISIQAYLNAYYGDFGEITVTTAPVFDTVMFPYSSDMSLGTLMFPYSADMSKGVEFYQYGSTANAPVVTIPAGLKNADVYPDFIADLNAIVAYGIQYSIVVN